MELTGTVAFIERAGAFFASYGIAIERVMTDNHWSYTKTTAVRDVIADLGAAHTRIRPHCPWQNGEEERFNRTLQTEWAHRQVFETNDQQLCQTAAPRQPPPTPQRPRRSPTHQSAITSLTAGHN